LPPEVLEYIDARKTNPIKRGDKQSIMNKISSWSIDVWSLGVVVLEIIVGFPVWMSYRGQIVRDDRSSS
jgi:serine/threonine protein kinase